MRNEFESIISNLDKFFRYIASGFIILFIIFYIDENLNLKSYHLWALIIVAFILGYTIYSIHRSIIERLIWGVVVWVYCFIKKDNPIVIEYKGKKETSGFFKILFELDTQRWLRRDYKENWQINSIQRNLDVWGAMINYMYCASYSLILTPIFINAFSFVFNIKSEESMCIILWSGCLLFVFSLISEYRITNREFRAIETHGRIQYKKINKPKD